LTARSRAVRLLGALAILALTLTVLSPLPRTRPAAAQTSGPVPAYLLVATDGGIFSFGGAGYYGSVPGVLKPGQTLNKPIVGMASTPDGGGYWVVASDGGIFSFGDAKFYGSTGNIVLNKPIVGMARTPDGKGYWLVASDGGVFSFGDAKFYGSTGNITLNQPIVGMAPNPQGGGYWLVAADGGIFSFGTSKFHGSTGNIVLNKPIIGMMAAPSGAGYLLLASDGGTFSFGTAPFYGSLGGVPLKNPIVASALTPSGNGYWFSDSVGEVSAFGQATYYGSAPSPLNQPIVGMAVTPNGTGAFVGGSYPSGSYGYDVSKFTMNTTCTTGLPVGDHDIAIVQVDGEVEPAASPPDYPNPCLSTEAAWAGAGLNLYVFMGNVGSISGQLCSNATSCFDVGYNAGIQAFQNARAADANTDVSWWLDVEAAGTYWTSSTADNEQTVQGALYALHNTEGLDNVGIYASPDVWNQIVGDYQPSVPYWMADWLTPPSGPSSCADAAKQEAANMLPNGPVEVVQYNSPSNDPSISYDEDYAC
jgi:ribosomal protein L24E